MELKNKFEMPKAEVILFDSADVITTSDPNELPGVNPFAYLGENEF